MALMQAQSPWAMISSPQASPLQRASAVGDLTGGGGGGGLDLSSAFSLGAGAAGGGGMDDTGGASEDDGSLDSVSPLLVALTQHQMQNMGDDTPTSEDKGLALAQAGFAMAAGDSPHPLANIGAGAMSGIQALQKAKQARALQRMKEAQILQSGALRQAALMDAAQQKAAALKQAKAIADEKAQEARDKLKQDKELADEKLKAAETAAGDRAQQIADRSAGIAEQRYTVNDRLRREQYQKSGQWAKIAGDDEHGVSGPPAEDQPYNGPQISDPTIPLRDRNKFKIEQPKQTQAIRAIDLTLNNVQKNATELLSHPGLSKAVGFGGTTVSKIPGTDAASFAAKLDSLKSQVFANAIQAMRDASRTGGAVGNVSDREGQRFESMIGSLSQAQDEDQFKKTLKDIVDYTDQLRASYHESYGTRYGDLPGKKEEPKLPTPGNRTLVRNPKTGQLEFQ